MCIHVFTSGFHRDDMCLHCSGCHVVDVPWFSLIFYISAHMALLGFKIAVCCFLSPHWWCLDELDEVIIGKTFTTCLSAALWLPGFAYSLRSGAQDIAACILLVNVSVRKENDVQYLYEYMNHYERNEDSLPYSYLHFYVIHGGFLKWWVSPTTMGFPTKNDQHLGCVMGGKPTI